MSGVLCALAGADPGVPPPPPITSVALGWSTGKDQFPSTASGTMPGHLTVSVTGGTAPFTYTVSFSGAHANMAISDTTSATTTLTFSGLNSIGDQGYATLNVRVRDSNGLAYNVEATDGVGALPTMTVTRGS
jgi:hypothetical protein